MIFTKYQVKEQCILTAPKFDFDWTLIYAICLQECSKSLRGEFEPDVARMEQGFYRRYVEDQNELATSTEVLLSASYGIMQMMGLSLKEVGYLQWWFDNYNNDEWKKVLNHSLSQIAIPQAIDAYCVNLEWMIEWGCRWMDVKRKKAKGDLRKMLTYWNGSSLYPDKIFEKMKFIK